MRSTTSARWRPRWLTAPASVASWPPRSPARGRPSCPAGWPRCRARRLLVPARGPAGRRRGSRSGRPRGRRARRAAGRRPSRSRAGGRRRSGRRRRGTVSSTITTRRSRSGCQVRTTTVAVAGAGPPVDGADVVAADVFAQRVELGAGPRMRTAERPSSSRSRASRAGQVPARVEGRQRPEVPGTSSVAWRAASPSGPRVRRVTPVRAGHRARRAQSGEHEWSRRRQPAGSGAGCRWRPPWAARRRGPAPGPIGVPGLTIVRRELASSPSRTVPTSGGAIASVVGDGRERPVDGRRAARPAAARPTPCPCRGAAAPPPCRAPAAAGRDR